MSSITAVANGNAGIVPPWLIQAKNPGIVPPWLQSDIHILPIEDAPIHALPVDETQFVSTPVSVSPMSLADAIRTR